MHNLKRIVLVSALCISMAFPSTALANEITPDSTSAEIVALDADTELVENEITEPEVATELVENEITEPEVTTEKTTPVEEITSETEATDTIESDTTTTEEFIVGSDVETETEPEPEPTPKYKGLVTIDGKIYYYKLDGSMIKNKMAKVNGNCYYFTKDGSAYTKTGTLVTGPDGHKYTFHKDGTAYLAAIKKIDGIYYYFGKSFYLFGKEDAIVKVNNEYYTFNKNGTVFTGGFKKVKDDYYYFQSNGKALKDTLKKTNGSIYYFLSNGRASKSWKLADGNLYHFGKYGKPITGWSHREKNDLWYYIDPTLKYATFKGNPLYRAYKKIKNASSGSNYIICVDSTACRCSIFKRKNGEWVPEKYWKCSPGKPSTPTVTGWYTVGGRGYSFGGSSYTCYYYTQFYGDYLFHSVLYHKGTFNIKKGTLGKRLSHGCVRLDINNAKWIYDNIPSGTTVCSYL